MVDEKDQELQALRERVCELQRRNDALEAEFQAEWAKLTPQQRAFLEAQWAERDSNVPLN